MPALKRIVFPQGGPLGPTITSLSPLPTGTVGVPYTFTFQAIGNNPPFTWAVVSGSLPLGTSLASNGVLSGTPTAQVTATFTVKVTDVLGLSAPQTFSFTVNPVSGGALGPQQLWPGVVDSSHIVVMAWPTPVGGEQTYDFYLNGSSTPVNSSPITPSILIGGGSVAQPFVVAGGLSPSTTYSVTASATVNGVKTQQSSPITMTTLAGSIGTGGATPPAAATTPESWIVAPPASGSLQSVPAGNHLFVVTPTGTNTTPSANPGGGQTYNGCSLAFALTPANLNLAGGDVIAITPGTYPVTNLTLPVFTGTNWTNIVSTLAPEYAGASGTLPAYSVRSSPQPTVLSLTTGLSIACYFSASASGTVMTVNEVFSGSLSPGQAITGSNVALGQSIVSNGTGTGGVGTYNMSVSAGLGSLLTGTIAPSGSQSIATFNASVNVPRGHVLTGTGVAASTFILNPTTGSTPSTTWYVTNVQTVSTSTTFTQNPGLSAGGATSATLTSAFTGRTGYYPVRFQNAGGCPFPTMAYVNESRNVLFTNGSTAIKWTTPLFMAATASIQVDLGNYVTPWDFNAPNLPTANAAPSMPILQFVYGGQGIGFAEQLGTSKVRMIGIAFMPTNTLTQINFAINQPSASTSLESVYHDRCAVYTPTDQWPNGMGYVTHAVGHNCNHGLYHQCYFGGLVDGTGGNGQPGGQDTNAFAITGGGPFAIQNCYLEAQNEGVITGGQPIFQATVPHDFVRRWNTCHKPTTWMFNAIGNEVKNHLELKVGIRVGDYGNLLWNNWYGAQSQGQWGRGIVYGARDQTAGWEPENGAFNPTVVTGITGSTITFTCAGATSNPFFFRGLNTGWAWLQGAGGVANSMFAIATNGVGGPTGGPFTITATAPFTGTYISGSGGTVVPSDVNCQGPWNIISDVDVHDNIVWDCASLVYDFGGGGDPSAPSYAARIRIQNNQFFGNPGTDGAGTQVNPFAVQIFGVGVDLIVDHNTILFNTANFNYISPATQSAAVTRIGPTTSNLGGFPGTSDRVQITNNVFGGKIALFSLPINNAQDLAALNGSFTNSTYSNNVQLEDAGTFAGTPTGGNTVGTNYAAVGYNNAGFANWTFGTSAPTSAPLHASDWNITTGTYATASTTGGPVGATFAGQSTLQFPISGAILNHGSWNGSVPSGVVAHLPQLGIILLGGYEGYGSLATDVANCKAANPNMLVFAYVNIDGFGPNNTGQNPGHAGVVAQMGNVPWWVYNNFNTKATIATDFNGVLDVVNCIQNRTSTTAPYPGGPTTAMTVRQWVAQYVNHYYGIGAAPALDGLFTDNFYYQPRGVTGGQNQADWNETGTAVANSTPSVVTAWQAAMADWDTQLRAVMGSGKLHIVNSADWVFASGPVYVGLLIGGQLETQSEYETSSGWAFMMQSYSAQMTSFKAMGGKGPIAIFTWESSVTNAYAVARYAICSCLLDNAYFTWDPGSNNIVWFDELSLNLGSPIAGPNNPTNGTYTNGGLTVWTQGVWRRDFQNGIVLVNPRGNGQKTITFASNDNGGTYWHFTGTQDPTTNNGQAITSVTLPDPNPGSPTNSNTGGSGIMLFRTAGH